MTQPYNRLVTKDPVAIAAAALPLLTEAEQSMGGLRGVIVQPEGEVRVGGPTITATKGTLLAAYQILDLTHFAGPVYAISTSGAAVNVQVTLGAS